MPQQVQSVCMNGHQISTTLPWDYEYSPIKFCEHCGTELITKCQNCSAPIPGNYKMDGVVDLTIPFAEIPSFCTSCATPYPWTSATINATRELIELSELNVQEKESLQSSITDILYETPQTALAATKFKIYAAKAGKLVGEGLRNFVIDFGVEVAKKTFLGN